MNVVRTGNAIYAAIRSNPVAIQKVRDEYAELALAMAIDPDSTAQVTSSTVNGQTFTTSQTMTNGQRLALLSWVCKCAEIGSPISTTTVSTFP
jgi:hypothetical protein